MKYFKSCRTAEEGKSLYRKLAREFHPDNQGGSDEKMKELNNEFSEFWEKFKDIHFSEKTGKTYHSEKKTTQTAEQFISIVNAIFSVSQDIEIEICGSWLWLHGTTYPFREELKRLGCRWSKGKKCWYWTTDPYQKTRKTLSVSERRSKYGYDFVEHEKYPEIAQA